LQYSMTLASILPVTFGRGITTSVDTPSISYINKGS
jgi:hypothetical protein